MSNLIQKNMEEQNNLDLCFDSIFEKNVRFQIEDNAVKFIQIAIEKLVSKLINKIDTCGNKKKTAIISEFLKQYKGFKFICNGTEKNEKILKTGSFYEETKNGYPDEFDYVYVLCTLEVEEKFEEFIWLKHYFTLNEFHDTIKDILTRQIKREDYAFVEGGKCVYFYGYDRKQGPSSKLTFKYKMKNIRTKIEIDIDVDIVPAFKVIDKRLPQRIQDVCFVEGFAERIATTSSYLITNEVSFTETERLFMLKELSPSHKKAYRLLKYILNGNGDGERLRKCIPKVGISTYMIKVAVISHHFSGRCDWKSKPSDCVRMILEDIVWFCINYGNDIMPSLRKFNGGQFEMQSDYVIQTQYSIQKVLRWLNSLRGNKIMYDDIKSVSKSIFDYTQKQPSMGNVSCSSAKGYTEVARSPSTSSKRLSLSLTDSDSHSLFSRGRNDSHRSEMYSFDFSQIVLGDSEFDSSSFYLLSTSSERSSSFQEKTSNNAKDKTPCKKLNENKARKADTRSEHQGRENLTDKSPPCLKDSNSTFFKNFEDVNYYSSGNKKETYGGVSGETLSLQNQKFDGEIFYSSSNPFLNTSNRSENVERFPMNPTTLQNQSDRKSEVDVEDFEFIIECGKSRFYGTRTKSTPCLKSDNISNQRIRTNFKKKEKKSRCILM